MGVRQICLTLANFARGMGRWVGWWRDPGTGTGLLMLTREGATSIIVCSVCYLKLKLANTEVCNFSVTHVVLYI